MLSLKNIVLLLALSLLFAACKTTRIVPPPVNGTGPAVQYAASSWGALPDWQQLDLTQSWTAFLQSCRALRYRAQWQQACAGAEQVERGNSAAQRAFLEDRLLPYQVLNPDGSDQGIITGYYEPLLHGSRVKTDRFRFPLYGVPDDMLEIDLGDAYPELKGKRLRGRLQGKRVLPYFKRAEIDAGVNGLKGRELFWVDDAVALFFLQIQGSGRIQLPEGQLVKVGYADQNGYPYVSIGRKLVEMGEMKLEEVSMQNIRAWGEAHPDKLPALLDLNPSYVFFRELPDGLSAPLGALGVPLTNEYSIAVDPHAIPLGAPVFLATTQPNSPLPLNRLMLAQDTGGAIRGAVRADFFWGFGDMAAVQAGKMRQQGRLWLLYPKGAIPQPN